MISTVLLVATLVAFGGYAYYNPPKTISSNNNKKSICLNYSNAPVSTLKVDLVHEMTSGYKKNQLNHIKRVMKDDAHSIWFDLETLKKFIYHIEYNATINDVTSKQLGIRIYYSRYPQLETWGVKYPDLSDFLNKNNKLLTQQYEKHHTLLMIPTILREGKHMDFNPKDLRTYEERMQNFEEYQATNNTHAIPALTVTKSLRSSDPTLAQNHGSIIPPADNFGEAF